LTTVGPRPSDAWRKVVPSMERVDPHLVQAVRQGSYVVDPRAVAEAMMRRRAQRDAARRLAAVLESGELDGGSAGIAEDGSGPRADVA
jgi:hypothetical protein